MATAHHPAPVPPALIRKIGALPAERIAEVEDFVEFLVMREGVLARSAAAASAPAFAAVWDNPEDSIYNAR